MAEENGFPSVPLEGAAEQLASFWLADARQYGARIRQQAEQEAETIVAEAAAVRAEAQAWAARLKAETDDSHRRGRAGIEAQAEANRIRAAALSDARCIFAEAATAAASRLREGARQAEAVLRGAQVGGGAPGRSPLPNSSGAETAAARPGRLLRDAVDPEVPQASASAPAEAAPPEPQTPAGVQEEPEVAASVPLVGSRGRHVQALAGQAGNGDRATAGPPVATAGVQPGRVSPAAGRWSLRRRR
jgi:hypothetical protein